jgi:hypothetical protein
MLYAAENNLATMRPALAAHEAVSLFPQSLVASLVARTAALASGVSAARRAFAEVLTFIRVSRGRPSPRPPPQRTGQPRRVSLSWARAPAFTPGDGAGFSAQQLVVGYLSSDFADHVRKRPRTSGGPRSHVCHPPCPAGLPWSVGERPVSLPQRHAGRTCGSLLRGAAARGRAHGPRQVRWAGCALPRSPTCAALQAGSSTTSRPFTTDLCRPRV